LTVACRQFADCRRSACSPIARATRSDDGTGVAGWLYGSAGVTEHDGHGWMAPAPPAGITVLRTLVFWPMSDDVKCADERRPDARSKLFAGDLAAGRVSNC